MAAPWTPAECDGVSAATATTAWKTTCSNLTSLGDAACWTNGVPTATSTVLFPADTNATMGTWHNSTWALPYIVLRAKSVIVADGAFVQLAGDGWEVSSCLLVDGVLSLRSNGTHVADWQRLNWTQTPVGDYAADPAQPLGTDCATVRDGFTPRICGPGKLLVRGGGTLRAEGLYASVFLSGSVLAGGSVDVADRAFMWGNLSSWGSYNASGYTYQHGLLFNYGVATLGSIAFDKWATTFVANTKHPLIIENFANLTVGGQALLPTQANYTKAAPGYDYAGVAAGGASALSDADAGSYRVSIINAEGSTLLLYAWLAPAALDLFNLGVVTWRSKYGDFAYDFDGQGTYYNRGTFVADGQSVYLNMYVCEGGTHITKNYGSFNFQHGSPNEASRATMRLCSLVETMPSSLQARYQENMRKRDIAARALTQDERHLVVGDGGDGCNWYAGHCYLQPYNILPPAKMLDSSAASGATAILSAAGVDAGFAADSEPVDATGLPYRRHKGDLRLSIQAALADHVVPSNPCGERRYVFANATFGGDGSGAVVSTVPVEIAGTVTLGVGTTWHVAAERSTAPFFGGGTLRVGRGASLFLGIDAALSHDGAIRVHRGGMLAVPRHARLAVTNHSLALEPGSKLHVDGRMNVGAVRGARVAVDACGMVDGIGEIAVDRSGVLSCSRDTGSSGAGQILGERDTDKSAGKGARFPRRLHPGRF